MALVHVAADMKGFIVREVHRTELRIQECGLLVGGINAYFLRS